MPHFHRKIKKIVPAALVNSVIGLWVIFNVRFVCVEVLRPSQPNRVMSSAVNLPNHTFTGQA